MVVNIGSLTILQAKIGDTYGQMRTDGVYIQEGTNRGGSEPHNVSRSPNSSRFVGIT